jgi:mono/diheme cytochrome c family protein
LKRSVAFFHGASLIGGIALLGVVGAAGTHSGGHGDDHSAKHTSADGMKHHAHDKWVDPPPKYADLISHKWADAEAIANGEKLYAKQCVTCHGVDGQGTGPIATSLRHPPADLTNNFHTEPGNGDGYLFWRVSEGGLAEPFRSQGSTMPAFKGSLSEDERWDVLAYVHTFFHQGLMKWKRAHPSGETQAEQETTSGGG